MRAMLEQEGGAAPAQAPAEPGGAAAGEGEVGSSSTRAAAAPTTQTTGQTAEPGLATHAPVQAMPVAARAAEPTLAETAAALAERFPALFTPGQPRAIKLRIQADIQQRAPGVFTKKQLSIFLHRHTTQTAYIRALVESAKRFDLDGQPAGEVAAEHLEAAKAELERRREVAAQRRAQARAAPPAAAAGVRERQQGPEADRPPQAAPPERAARSAPSHPSRGPRPGRPGRQGHPGRPGAARPPRPPRVPLPARSFVTERAPMQPPPMRGAAAAEAPLPEDPQRRERAQLLRAFEASPLVAANFSALKGLALAEFEAQIALACRERAEREARSRAGGGAGGGTSGGTGGGTGGGTS